jgi:hypothetical protein
MRAGLLAYTLGLGLAVVLVESGASPNWRALAFLPFCFGSILIFQAAYAICPMRAMRGERETEHGVERVANPQQRRHDKRRAVAVFVTACGCAVVTTAALYFLP